MLRLLYRLLFFCIALSGLTTFAQGKFQLPDGQKKLKIKTKLVNNLVILPVTVNGIELSFLLDTGVRSTILFNVDADYNLKLNNKSSVWLSGAGDGEATEAIKSVHNIISLGSSTAIDQMIYYLPDGEYNFSSRLGFPVHGIIGYELFKDFIVEINYQRNYVQLHDREFFNERKYQKRSSVIPLDLIEGKPYVDLEFLNDDLQYVEAKLLLDSGSGDALWLFENTHSGITVSKNSFKDHLGLGLSGEVTGVRAKLPKLIIGDYSLSELNVAYPDMQSLSYLKEMNTRNGSLGAEVLKRFTVLLDYAGSKMYLAKKNRYFDLPFKYDRSGLVIQHAGFDLVAIVDNQISRAETLPGVISAKRTSIFLETNTVQFPELKLTRNYEIAAIREDSPGAEAGLIVGDKLIKVNGRAVANLKLQEITNYFYREEGSVLKLKIDRNGVVFNCKLKLKKMLD